MHKRPVAALLVALHAFLLACSIPDVNLEAEKPLPLRSTIVAADGTLLARLYKQNRAYAPLGRIPRSLVDAVLAAEDARFYQHPGIDLRSVARAAAANLRSGTVVQGGSTITQQYVKNTYIRDPDRTFARKARELRFALAVEDRLTKDEILERYLNTVYFGEGAYGVKAASEVYFRRPLNKLSVDQSALLAAMIKAPSSYDPRAHARAARERRDYVLRRMAELGTLAPIRLQRALTRGLGVVADPPRLRTREPYFVEAVRQEVLGDERLGETRDLREKRLLEGGLRVETTLVPRLQRAAEDAVTSTLGLPGDPEAAVVAIRPSSGRIVAMVGGRSWSASQVNLALGAQGGGSGRQPGSAFKPIVAAAALESGIELDELYDSSEANFELPGGETWAVHNAEGGDHGLMQLDEALVHSVNGVYARLGLQLGPEPIIQQARLMGVRSRLPSVYSIALGSAQVSVLDMATAYATLANGGNAISPTTIRRIGLPDGELLEPEQRRTPHALEPGNAYLLTQTLEQVIQRGTGVGANIGRPAAGKTGTTNDYADAWFVGYTPQLVAAVWVGYPEGSIPMTSVHGITVMGGTFPASIWRSFMSVALENAPVREFMPPPGEMVTVEIDPRSGLLAAPWCPGETVTMLRQLVPEETCPPPPPEPVPAQSPSATPTASPTPSASPKPEPTPSPDGDKGGDEPKKDDPKKHAAHD